MARARRACAECKRRRMRCDETIPRCQQCQRAGRLCSGPGQGPIIVDMTKSTASHPNSIHRPRVCEKAKLTTIVCTPNRCQSISKSPAGHQVMTELFVARFISSFCGTHRSRARTSWIMVLPQALPSGVAWPTIRSSLRAASVAHYSIEVDEPGAMIQSQEMYGEALGLHRRFIRRNLDAARLSYSTAFEVVASNTMLAFFEAIRCSHIEAYGFHISAAATVLEDIGPDQCQTGLLNELFFTVRSQMALVSFLTHKPIKFCTEAWNKVVFSGQTTKPISERLMDIIISLLQMLWICKTDECYCIREVQDSVFRRHSQLANLWALNEDISASYGHGHSPESASQHPTTSNPVALLIHMYFNCAWLILSYLSTNYLDDRLEGMTPRTYCDEILSSIEHLESRSIGCAYMRMMLPLALVSLHSSDADQRQQARDKLRSWQAQKSMPGLCAFSIHHLDDCGRARLESSNKDGQALEESNRGQGMKSW